MTELTWLNRLPASGPIKRRHQKNSFDTVVPPKKSFDTVVPKKIYWSSKKTFVIVVPNLLLKFNGKFQSRLASVMFHWNGYFSETHFTNFFAKMKSANQSNDNAEFLEKKICDNFKKYYNTFSFWILFLQPKKYKMFSRKKKLRMMIISFKIYLRNFLISFSLL